MIWRYHAEVGMASIATSANLVKAAAVLDDFAAGFPEDQRFRLHLTFAIEPPDPAMGPATLAFLSWHYQSRFSDFYGRPDRDPEDFEEARKLLARPHPAAFFKKLAAEIE